MAQCEQCRRKKVEIMSYGGMLLCSCCMNIHNPKKKTVHRLTEGQIEYMKSRIIELESEIHHLNQQLLNNSQLFDGKDYNKVDVINGFWNY